MNDNKPATAIIPLHLYNTGENYMDGKEFNVEIPYDNWELLKNIKDQRIRSKMIWELIESYLQKSYVESSVYFKDAFGFEVDKNGNRL